MTDQDRFEERLLTELRQVVAERPEPLPAASAKRPYGRFALAGAGVATAVAAIAVFASSGDNTTSAYAIDKKPDGVVSVEIKSLKDADGLETGLRAAGVPAVVDYTPAGTDGCRLPAMPATPAEPGMSGKATPVAPTLPGEAESGKGERSLRVFGHQEAGAPGAPALKESGQGQSPDMTMPTEPVPPTGKVTADLKGGSGATTFTIDPRDIPEGEKVYVTTSTGKVDTAGEGTPGVLSAVAISIGSKGPEMPHC